MSILRVFSAQLESSLLFGCSVSISRTLYSLFSSIVDLLSRGLLEFSSVRPFCVFIELCYVRFFCLQLGCCVSILRSICSLLISIVAFGCCTFLEFCKVCFLRQESLTFFRGVFSWIVSFYFMRSIRWYFSCS